MVSLDKGSQWVNVKQKSLRQTPSTFRHNQAGIFRNYSGIFRHIKSPVQPWHI